MPLFRFQTGSFEESMKTQIEVKDMADLKLAILQNQCPYVDYENMNLTCDFYCHDKRNNWDTYMIRNNGDPIGFSNEQIKNEDDMKKTFDEVINEIERTNDAIKNTKSADEQLYQIKKSIEDHFWDKKVGKNVFLSVQEIINERLEFELKYKRMHLDIQCFLEENKRTNKNTENELNLILNKFKPYVKHITD